MAVEEQQQARSSVVHLSGGSDDKRVFAVLCSAHVVLRFTEVSFYQDDAINHPTVSLFSIPGVRFIIVALQQPGSVASDSALEWTSVLITK